MPRECDICGKRVARGFQYTYRGLAKYKGGVGRKVTGKTKRKFRPNLCNVTLISDALQRRIKLRISAHALKSVEHRGGLDAFLMKASDEDLSPECLKLKREIKKAQAAEAAA